MKVIHYVLRLFSLFELSILKKHGLLRSAELVWCCKVLDSYLGKWTVTIYDLILISEDSSISKVFFNVVRKCLPWSNFHCCLRDGTNCSSDTFNCRVISMIAADDVLWFAFAAYDLEILCYDYSFHGALCPVRRWCLE